MCAGCGLVYDTISPQDAVVAVRSFPRRYRALLNTPGAADGTDAVHRRRPEALAWSAIEHTAHVADVLDHLGPAIRRITVEDNPSITFFDKDERAADQAYNDLALAEVMGWLDIACAELASVLERVSADDWARTARLEAGEQDALTMARNGVHVASHRLRDVERVLAAVRGRPA